MTILHPAELRDMTPAERQAELESLETELLNAQAVKAAGGMPENPARIGEMRRTIARIKTIQREEGDLSEDIDETQVAETETITSGLFGRGGDDEEEEPPDESAEADTPAPDQPAEDAGGEAATEEEA